jgi:hypothetical protein
MARQPPSDYFKSEAICAPKAPIRPTVAVTTLPEKNDYGLIDILRAIFL